MARIYLLTLIVIFTASCKNEKSPDPTSPATEIEQNAGILNDTLNDLLRVENPTRGQLIGSPLEITGKARGYWFFEANATVELLDGNMNQISETYTSAIGDWMNEDWVPFTGTMEFEKPATENGFLIFHKANASGLQEHDMSDTIPVKF